MSDTYPLIERMCVLIRSSEQPDNRHSKLKRNIQRRLRAQVLIASLYRPNFSLAKHFTVNFKFFSEFTLADASAFTRKFYARAYFFTETGYHE